ncbi:hypothetical protein SAMN05720354_10880 [Nitrosospira sp. Nsp1]|nr:hypothetical protein SAMN05720354_10880 [Nitrosospira sp. Nsp1]
MTGWLRRTGSGNSCANPSHELLCILYGRRLCPLGNASVLFTAIQVLHPEAVSLERRTYLTYTLKNIY